MTKTKMYLNSSIIRGTSTNGTSSEIKTSTSTSKLFCTDKKSLVKVFVVSIFTS